jgi:phytoene synthase
LFFTTARPSRHGYAPLVATTYDGRPTKIEGNPGHPASLGATDVFSQASVLSLYDPDRSQTVTRYANFDNVLDYCRRSANPVGRLLLALYGAQTPANLAASDAICTGLQLTNFWQDIAIDWQKNRIYLPQDDLRRFGVDESHIAEARVNAAWRALLVFEVERARGLLESGRPLTRALPWRVGLELSAIISGGLRILDRIDAVGGDVFAHRPVLAIADWIVVAWRALVPARKPAP